MSIKFQQFSQKTGMGMVMKAVRSALIITMPILMIGSIALMFQSLPIPAYQKFITEFYNGVIYDFFKIVNSACFGFFSVYIVINVSITYLSEYTSSIEDYLTTPAIALAGFLIIVNVGTDRFDIKDLSVNGTFVALIASIVISAVVRKIKNVGRDLVKIGASGGILYQKAIKTIIPSAIVLAGCAVVSLAFRIIFRVDGIPELLEVIMNRIFGLVNNDYIKSMIYMFTVQILWSLGIHGGNIMENAVQANFIAIDGSHIFSKTFYDAFVNIGGCGATLCVVIAIFLCSRHVTSRNVAKGAVFPVLFNINELITFGYPIIFNPIMAIPFILVPFVSLSISYAATAMGLVPHVIQAVEWTTPVFLSGYVATGSMAGSILQLICIVIGVLIYIPFIKRNEELIDRRFMENVEHLTEIMKKGESENAIPNLTSRGDIYGTTAKTMINELEQALRLKELFMMYQPQIDNDGRCIGAEALIRWNMGSVGYIYPPLIIELAKEGGLLAQLEEFIFDSACRTASRASGYLGDHVKISINITANSLNRPTLVQEIANAARHHNIDTHCIWVEITENEVITGSEEIISKLRELKNNGHNLLIDDFSMGHTSLKYLQTQCFDGIKLDASITKDVYNNRVGQEIIASLADLGKRLDVGIIAEYVVQKEQKEMLKALGCGIYQGYLYSEPLKEEDFISYIKDDKPRI